MRLFAHVTIRFEENFLALPGLADQSQGRPGYLITAYRNLTTVSQMIRVHERKPDRRPRK